MKSTTLFENASAAGTTGLFDMWGHTVGAVYVVFSAGVTGGSVVIETAHSQSYGGTWHTIATVSAQADKVVYVPLSGHYRAVRARIATAISGGTASAYGYAAR